APVAPARRTGPVVAIFPAVGGVFVVGDRAVGMRIRRFRAWAAVRSGIRSSCESCGDRRMTMMDPPSGGLWPVDRKYAESAPAFNSVRFEVRMVDRENSGERLPLGEIHDSGVCKIHSAVPISRHQAVQLR